MRKICLFLFAALCSLAASADYRTGYYDAMEGKKTDALKAAAKACVSAHVRLDYTALPDYWIKTDIYPELFDGQKRWWDMYSNNIYLIKNGQTGRTSFSANRMQREHSVPKSWWKKNGDVEYTPAYSDMWNLYPSDGEANQAKLNYAFGVCQSASFNNGCTRVGPAKSGYGGGSGNVFEPDDEYKGDFARAIFYMATVYDDLTWVTTWMFANNSYPSLQPWAVNMLLDWTRRDPVSQKEIDRNNGVENAQGNRNPFIDFPNLAEYIWGTKVGQIFKIADQENATGTPPVITGDPEIIRPVAGEALDFSQVALGQTTNRLLEIYCKNLTSPLSLRVVGDDRAMFSIGITSIPAATLNSEEVYRLEVFYKPTSVGSHTARLRLYDGGLPSGGDVAVTLTGEAYDIPTLTTLEAYNATDITPTGYTAHWSEAPEVVDYYILNRVRYTSTGAEAETLSADANYLEIDDRRMDVTESYTVQSSRLGYTSPVSNSITVAAGASVGEVNCQPLIVGTMQDGIVIISECGQLDVKVFDADGRLIAAFAETAPGQYIALPRGLYLVTARGSQPVKAIVR